MGPAHRLRTVLVRFGAAPFRLQIMTGVALAATVTLILAVLWAGRELPAGEESGEVVRVGVVEGQPLAGYLHAAEHELGALTDPAAPASGEIWALVTLRAYATPARLPGLLDGAAVAQVYARVPLPDARTQVTRIPVYLLPADVTAGMLGAAVARDKERADYLRLSRALPGDGRNEQRLRTAYETAARTAAQEAAAYRTGCSCVFAAVVRATPVVLSGLAGRPAVRAVDPAPEVRRLDRAEFRAPLPEETARAEPSEPAVPSLKPAVATGGPAPIPSSLGTPVRSASPRTSAPEPPRTVVPSGTLAVPSAPDPSPARDGRTTPSPAAGSGSGSPVPRL